MGVSGVGKTSLIYSFELRCTMINQLSTMGLEEKYGVYSLTDGSIIGCTLLDTNGTERYRCLNEAYFKKADGCLIIYDITNKRSFEEIEKYYIPKLKEKCRKDIVVLLLGNKSDLEDMRKISYEEGSELALKYNFIFKEVSCLENINVVLIFQKIIETSFYEKKKRWNNKDDTITLSSNRTNLNRTTKCC